MFSMLNRGYWLTLHIILTSPDSVCAKIAVNGSSLFNRLSSLGIITSLKGHSRSPLWWPYVPHLAHFTLRTSIPNGFSLAGRPVSNLQHISTQMTNIKMHVWEKKKQWPEYQLRCKFWLTGHAFCAAKKVPMARSGFIVNTLRKMAQSAI